LPATGRSTRRRQAHWPAWTSASGSTVQRFVDARPGKLGEDDAFSLLHPALAREREALVASGERLTWLYQHSLQVLLG
jgi:hypothetical protein